MMVIAVACLVVALMNMCAAFVFAMGGRVLEAVLALVNFTFLGGLIMTGVFG